MYVSSVINEKGLFLHCCLIGLLYRAGPTKKHFWRKSDRFFRSTALYDIQGIVSKKQIENEQVSELRQIKAYSRIIGGT